LRALVCASPKIFRCISDIKKNSIEYRKLVGDSPQKHHMVKLGLSITIRVVYPTAHDPILPAIRIDIQAVDHCDALDQAAGVSTVLLFDQLNIMRVVFVKNVIIKHQTSVG